MIPRRFETWETALYFAQWSARRRRIRTRVRRSSGLAGLVVWEVTAA